LDRRLKVETARSQTADLPVAAVRKVEAVGAAAVEVGAAVEHAEAVVVALDEARAEAALEVVDPRPRDDTI
jgi:hypothetical protein